MLHTDLLPLGPLPVIEDYSTRSSELVPVMKQMYVLEESIF
jgi:hypothetical protein